MVLLDHNALQVHANEKEDLSHQAVIDPQQEGFWDSNGTNGWPNLLIHRTSESEVFLWSPEMNR